MSQQMTFWDIPPAISSPGSGGGHTPYNLPNGPQIDPSGQEVVHVNHSALQGKDGATATNVIYGRSFDGSYRSAALQSFLENRLRARLAVNGSPEFDLIWRTWDMQSGPPICALRASVRRILGSGCGGWPTPMAEDGRICLRTTGARPSQVRRDCISIVTRLLLQGEHWTTVSLVCGSAMGYPLKWSGSEYADSATR